VGPEDSVAILPPRLPQVDPAPFPHPLPEPHLLNEPDDADGLLLAEGQGAGQAVELP
jgi:hypothetical protein